MGRCKSHNIKLNKPDFSVSVTDRCACFLWILIPSVSFCTQSWSVSYAAENTCSPSSSQVRHIPTFQPSSLRVVANLSPGWAARTGRAWKKDSCHRTAAPDPSHHHCPAQRLQHQSKKVISKKRPFLVKYCRWVHCPWRRGENKFSGDYKTKLSSLLEPVAIHFPETCPGWMLLMLSSPPTCICTGTKSELLKHVLCFYFCCPLPCLPESHRLSNKSSF